MSEASQAGLLNREGLALFRMGFRPFFLAAGLFAIVAMGIWTAHYSYAVDIHFTGLTAMQWHAHEMIFGYVVAVVAGFLLTAIRNWTGIEVLNGTGLALLSLLWLVARIIPLAPVDIPFWLQASIDVSFLIALGFVCLRPIMIAKQVRQAGVISKVFLLAAFHVLYYLGVAGISENGERWGLYSSVYTVVGLILLMMRRVVPMFIKNGVEGEYEARNHGWVDISSMVLLLIMWFADVFLVDAILLAISASTLTVLHGVRLAGWYTKLIWRKPLVWVLVAAYFCLIIGFLLKALAAVDFSAAITISPNLALHAWTVGGMGLITIGMMARVSLGHTGRDIFAPPRILLWCFLLLSLSFITRVVLPLFSMAYYGELIMASQVFWILSFGIFVLAYAPVLMMPRVDGKAG